MGNQETTPGDKGWKIEPLSPVGNPEATIERYAFKTKRVILEKNRWEDGIGLKITF